MRVQEEAILHVQGELDRMYSDAVDVLGDDATARQIGTYTHTTMGRYVDDNALDLIDPSTGYRIRPEVSFDANGVQVPYGTAGSVRPDIVIERLRPGSLTEYQVVTVVDLKTGQAGISASWEREIQSRLRPSTPTVEFRVQ